MKRTTRWTEKLRDTEPQLRHAIEPAVFLDRDGTVNREVHHLRHVEQFELLDGAAEAIRLLNEYGMRVVIVTNQAAVGRGLLTESGLDEIHVAMHALLSQHGAHVDAVYYCPHHPTAGVGAYRIECTCRKPGIGSLRRAAQDLRLDLKRSFLVGDKRSDLQAGRAAGCGTVLVRTGYGRTTGQELASRNDSGLADCVAENLMEAAQWILARST